MGPVIWLYYWSTGQIKLDSSLKSDSPQRQLGMSQQKVQQRFQEREKELKELQQAVESFKVSIVDQRRHTISLLSSSEWESEICLRALEQSAALGLSLLESEVKYLLFADDLVASVPNQGGPTTAAPRYSAQILPDLGPDSKSQLDKNNGVPKKVQLPGTEIQILSRQRCSRAHKKHTYLGLNISALGNSHKAMNDLRHKARRAFYTIKRNIKFDIPIRIPKYLNQL